MAILVQLSSNFLNTQAPNKYNNATKGECLSPCTKRLQRDEPLEEGSVAAGRNPLIGLLWPIK